jgi:hypothetical protein
MNHRHPSFSAFPLWCFLLGTIPSLLLSPSFAESQTKPVLTWGGEVRPRLYGREPVQNDWDHWISMRTRLGLDARLPQGIGLFIQVQDVRFWGEELSNRDRSADAVDFHQAYLEVDSIPGVGGLIRAGRQEVHLGGGRLISAPDWGQAGQSFDGIRWMRPFERGQVDLVYLRLKEGTTLDHDFTADFTAAWMTFEVSSAGSLEILGIHDRAGEPNGTSQTTLGPTIKGGSGPLNFKLQGMYQFGERVGVDVSAHMVAFSGSLDVLDGRGRVTLWYDHLSGNKDPGEGSGDAELGSFTTLFGARHRFFGRGDYFLDIPRDTENLGLRDAALKLAFEPTPLFSLNLDVHAFSTAERGTLTSQTLAQEADIWIKYRFREALDLEAGYALTWAGQAMEELGRLEGAGNSVYLMSSFHF